MHTPGEQSYQPPNIDERFQAEIEAYEAGRQSLLFEGVDAENNRHSADLYVPSGATYDAWMELEQSTRTIRTLDDGFLLEVWDDAASEYRAPEDPSTVRRLQTLRRRYAPDYSPGEVDGMRLLTGATIDKTHTDSRGEEHHVAVKGLAMVKLGRLADIASLNLHDDKPGIVSDEARRILAEAGELVAVLLQTRRHHQARYDTRNRRTGDDDLSIETAHAMVAAHYARRLALYDHVQRKAGRSSAQQASSGGHNAPSMDLHGRPHGTGTGTSSNKRAGLGDVNVPPASLMASIRQRRSNRA